MFNSFEQKGIFVLVQLFVSVSKMIPLRRVREESPLTHKEALDHFFEIVKLGNWPGLRMCSESALLPRE